jgi:hypothetical protein
MSIAREFIRRGREIEVEQTVWPIENADLEAEEWDHAAREAALEPTRKDEFGRWRPRQRIRTHDPYADFTERGPSILSSADYGRGTVALIVKHAEDRAP